MSTFLFKDANRAAFQNAANKLFHDNDKPYMKINIEGIRNYPEGDNEYTIYTTKDPEESEILERALKDKYFKFPVSKIKWQEIYEIAKKFAKSMKD